jgi:uncharacterized Zn finger protein
VVDLQISRGRIAARVSGSALYQIEIKIKPLPASLWQAIQTECAGKIDSLMELLQGKLSTSVMQIVTRAERGLFPAPKEIDLDCSCPDWADLCKHVAASLYGVGARLDQSPELLFLLRGVDAADLISKASAAEAVRQTAGAEGAAAMSELEMAEVFGIEMATDTQAGSPKPPGKKKPVPAPASPASKPGKRSARPAREGVRSGAAPSPRSRKAGAKAGRRRPAVRKQAAPRPIRKGRGGSAR